MFPPTPQEKRTRLKDMRERFISTVNKDKDTWEELSLSEKQEVDKLCRKLYNIMQW